MSNTVLKNVKVAVLRNTYDNGYRQANVHYHACVGAGELKSWQAVAQRVLEEATTITCNRASEYDKHQMASAIVALEASLEKSNARIEQARQSADTKQQPETKARPELRLIAGGAGTLH